MKSYSRLTLAFLLLILVALQVKADNPWLLRFSLYGIRFVGMGY